VVCLAIKRLLHHSQILSISNLLLIYFANL
jgi:hypothetical protein